MAFDKRLGRAPSPLEGEGRGGGAVRAKRGHDRFKDAIKVFEYVAVPEANDPIAACLQPFGPLAIFDDLLGVLSAIDFNDELGLGAEEVDHEGADGLLASEAEAVELTLAQMSPQNALRFCRVLPKVACMGGWHAR